MTSPKSSETVAPEEQNVYSTGSFLTARAHQEQNLSRIVKRTWLCSVALTSLLVHSYKHRGSLEHFPRLTKAHNIFFVQGRVQRFNDAGSTSHSIMDCQAFARAKPGLESIFLHPATDWSNA